MIIVSQDKKRTVENLNLGIRKEEKYVIYNTEIGEDLGEYATEERTKEVLEEITATYIRTEQYKVEDEMTRMRIFTKGIFMYEMPAE